MFDTFAAVTVLAAALGFLAGVFLSKARILWAPATEIENLNSILLTVKKAYLRRYNKKAKNMGELAKFVKEAL